MWLVRKQLNTEESQPSAEQRGKKWQLVIIWWGTLSIQTFFLEIWPFLWEHTGCILDYSLCCCLQLMSVFHWSLQAQELSLNSTHFHTYLVKHFRLSSLWEKQCRFSYKSCRESGKSQRIWRSQCLEKECILTFSGFFFFFSSWEKITRFFFNSIFLKECIWGATFYNLCFLKVYRGANKVLWNTTSEFHLQYRKVKNHINIEE